MYKLLPILKKSNLKRCLFINPTFVTALCIRKHCDFAKVTRCPINFFLLGMSPQEWEEKGKRSMLKQLAVLTDAWLAPWTGL